MTNSKAVIKTNFGEIVIELFDEESPITTENFKKYVNEKFYDGTIFHRIIENFMIQGGGYDFNGNEKRTHAPIKLESRNGLSNKRGTLAMARTSVPNSATSQFFINTKDNDFLDYGVRDEGYAVFGKVIKGLNIIDEISKIETDENDFPLQEAKIISIQLIKP